MKLLALAAVVVLVAGCSKSESLGNGPVTAGSSAAHSTTCLPMPASERDATVGNDVLRNTGDKDAIITAVSPVDAGNVRIQEAVVVVATGTLLGSSTKWPPRSAGRSTGRGPTARTNSSPAARNPSTSNV
ncbi:hypothetical protein ACFV9C_17355 [Kribbella sp. NPDC059898]|uniref:hypothetical protein n=1 Tax=Kribbella sp. NPDC059898 TaxID=3346995 RepID=UPI003668FFE3